MNTTLFIALRYLFSKKSHNAINWVSGISVAGVATATAAMVCILSVFNGFRSLVERLFTTFDPEIRVELVHGKTIAASDPVLQRLRASDCVAVYTEVLEEHALVRNGNQQVVVTVKGVDDNFAELTDIEDILIGNPGFCTHTEDLQQGICGIGVANELGLPLYFAPLQVWAPKHGERVNMANPTSSFRRAELHPSGSFFCVSQGKYDDNVIVTSIDFARRLFAQDGRLSHVELRLADGATKADIKRLVDERFRVLDRYEQQADMFRIMNVEKLIAYLFFSFIILIAAFNIVGSLSMLIIEKHDDAQTLRALGARESTVSSIFATEGRLIGTLGAVIGMCVGLLLCWLQIQFGFIRLGNSEGSFIVDTYPVVVEWTDVLIVFATVLAVSWFTVIWPVRNMKNTAKV